MYFCIFRPWKLSFYLVGEYWFPVTLITSYFFLFYLSLSFIFVVVGCFFFMYNFLPCKVMQAPTWCKSIGSLYLIGYVLTHSPAYLRSHMRCLIHLKLLKPVSACSCICIMISIYTEIQDSYFSFHSFTHEYSIPMLALFLSFDIKMVSA